ncbi:MULTISPECIES: NUDIX hydrolase [Kaistella]|jgi:8-oxo-dGTP pyrophosphatase MutT (NUDIX family)|uniref:CoA pyrophosphatase n=1 Tax=Kaistella pullorum TaxID=2763074 RepID=A0ABR8WPR3_9FLAO|nr:MULTISPECIES: CoA pyrophosphatase [Kaistella]MBD8019014.1 CoA pyrophosphatase [Kaistella pullorum]
METFGRDLVKRIQAAELPGENAHAIYSPPYRPLYSYGEILTKNPKFAAVNILLYLKDSQWYFPLIVRTENERDRHSGQISLPGGKKESDDEDFAHTAKRETCEEVGVEQHYIRVIREMSPIYIPPSNFYVKPYVSYTKRNPEFFLQQSEATELIEFPVDSLLNIAGKPQMRILPGSRGVAVPVIEFNGYLIWGATSMILSEFSNLMKNL